ncbi:MAG: ribosome-binding factor A [Deltaproteobacteria bacterium 37-65-8]|nr:30S ribosome-binding factor RbfA [Deltaproteobacteria bacterium]OYV99348.1 MAG: ribosome-binding factor A [Deltaproteobacteria bacterium 37-65-8]HQT96448.1 30S ribosome-binding factor RbfA [Thermodesulfobacteriota bacterium]
MKGRGDRPARVGERIREELSLLLLRKVNDPGLAPVTVTEVSVTPDLRIAHVNYSALVAKEERPAVAKALRRSSGFLRRELGHLLGLRYAPELQFHYDDSFDRGARIDAILREIPEGKDGPDEG